MLAGMAAQFDGNPFVVHTMLDEHAEAIPEDLIVRAAMIAAAAMIGASPATSASPACCTTKCDCH